jgi:hypothetical protein
MYSKAGQSIHSNQKVGQLSTKNIQRVGQMASHNKSSNAKPAQPNIQEQAAQYNKYSK